MSDQAPQEPTSRRISAAGRLFALLQDLIAKGGDTILSTLAKTAGASEADRSRAYMRLGELFQLIIEAKQDVARHPELKQDLYLGALSGVENALLSVAPPNPWTTMSGAIQQSLIGLEFCAEQLDRLSDEGRIPQGELDQLLKAIEDLQKEFLSATLDPELKRLLVGKLEDVRAAILNYRVTGAAAIRRAVDSGVGVVVRSAPQLKAAGKVKQITDFLEMLVKVDTVIEKVIKYAPLAAPLLRKLLGSGPDA